MHIKYILWPFLFLPFLLLAVEVETEELPVTDMNAPWFTGPLLAPSGAVIPMGSINVEPYVYIAAYRGAYTPEWKCHDNPIFWSYVFNPFIQFGIAPRVDLTLSPTMLYNKTQGKHFWGMGDFYATLGIQILDESTYIPNIKLALEEQFPVGKNNQLDPGNLLTDGMGAGCYITSLELVIGKLIPVEKFHYLNFRFAMSASIYSSIYLKGISSYGGNPNTRGVYNPPVVIDIDLALEYSITKRWAWALDILYQYGTTSTFRGKNGQNLFSPLGGQLSHPSSQFSLAPAIEYNWSKSIGLIAGFWFTVAGSNSNCFRNGVIAFNYYK